MSATVHEQLCDWCRTRLAAGLLDNDPCCLECADGLLVGDGLPLGTVLAIEDRSRPIVYRRRD